MCVPLYVCVVGIYSKYIRMYVRTYACMNMYIYILFMDICMHMHVQMYITTNIHILYKLM